MSPRPKKAGIAPLRGIRPTEIIVSTVLDPFLGLRALSGYCGLSVRTLRTRLADAVHPLPHYQIGGKILVRRSEFDAWAMSYRRLGREDIDRLVAETMKGL
jgi:hypothetical protein